MSYEPPEALPPSKSRANDSPLADLNHPQLKQPETIDINIIRDARVATESWISALGPIEHWPRIFREKYDEACCDTVAVSTQVAIDTFLGKVVQHIDNGKQILKGFEQCNLVRNPLTKSQVDGDFLLAGDILTTLHRGIALLEARLELLAPSGAHLHDLHSTIRQHESFVDLV